MHMGHSVVNARVQPSHPFSLGLSARAASCELSFQPTIDPNELNSNESYEVWKKKKIEKYSCIFGPVCQWRTTAQRLQLLKQSSVSVCLCVNMHILMLAPSLVLIKKEKGKKKPKRKRINYSTKAKGS